MACGLEGASGLSPGSPSPAPGRTGLLLGARRWTLACFQGLEDYLRGREFQSPLILDEDQVRELRP